MSVIDPDDETRLQRRQSPLASAASQSRSRADPPPGSSSSSRRSPAALGPDDAVDGSLSRDRPRPISALSQSATRGVSGETDRSGASPSHSDGLSAGDGEDTETALAAPLELLEGSEARFGRYRLLKRIAFGGMGEVFLAESPTRPGELIVVKRILQHLRGDDRSKRMFLGEAKLQSVFDCDGIVKVLDVGEENGLVYLAMEFVHGVSWRMVVDRSRRRRRWIPLAFVVEMVRDAAHALAYAHDLKDRSGALVNVVHRDVNPHNVLVTFEGQSKLIDFGIAKSDMALQQTETGTIKGKFAYMSPEQSAAEPIDRRSDLFALGLCITELVTLKNPFKKQNVVLTLEAIQRETPPPIDRRRKDAAPLQPIVDRCLQKDPRQRYKSGYELAADLDRLLQSGAIAPAALPLGDWLHEVFAEELANHAALLAAAGVTRAPRTAPDRAAFDLDSVSELDEAAPDDVVADALASEPTLLRADAAFAGPGEPTASTPAPRLARTLAAQPPVVPTVAVLAVDDAVAPTTPIPTGEAPRSRAALVALASLFVVGLAGGAAAWWFIGLDGEVPPVATAKTPERPLVAPGPGAPEPVAPAPVAPEPVVDAKPVEAAGVDAKPVEPVVDAKPVEPVVDAKPVDTVVDAPGDLKPQSPAQKPKPKPERQERPFDRQPDRQPEKAAAAVAVGRLSVAVEGGGIERKLLRPGEPSAFSVAVSELRVTVKAEATDGAAARVTLDATPWAVVLVDGVGRGKTPVSGVVVPGGKKVTLRFTRPGAEPVVLVLSYASAG